MLTIYVPMSEDKYDEENNEFIVDVFPLELEHSLVSLSKWESKFAKPFLVKDQKTTEETLFYIRAMCLTPDVPPEVWERISNKNIEQVTEYIDSKQTATWFTNTSPETQSAEVVTNEIIYYWLTTFRIPWEAQHWHLNRLFTLIRVFDLKQAKPKPMSRAEAAARQRELNRQRLEKHNTTG